MSEPPIPDVDIDPDGVFKYILLTVTLTAQDGTAETKQIVRGYEDCPYHADVNDKVTEELQKAKSEGLVKKWSAKVLGGGRIDHDADGKKIKVYGYSMGYGKADHEDAAKLIGTSYPDYTITCSNEGY